MQVFNLLPGQGLGFTGSGEIAFGLDPVSVTIIKTFSGVSKGTGWKSLRPYIPPKQEEYPKMIKLKAIKRKDTEEIKVIENNYTVNKQLNDDEDLFDILYTIFDVIN